MILGVVDLLYRNGSSLGEESHHLILDDASTLDLTVDVEVSLLFELINDWDPKGSKRLSLRQPDIIEVLQKGRTLVPRIRNPCVDIHILD